MLDVGRVVKPHGLSGRVVVELWTNRLERMRPGAVLHGPGGRLEVEEASPLPEAAGQARWLVRFSGIDGRDGAEHLRGAVLRAEPLEVEGALWVHELVGAALFDDAGGQVGVVEAVEANPASDLLVLADGRVVPLTFVATGPDGRLTVSGPPGLLDG